MYLIGISNYEFIKIVDSAALYDGQKVWYEIRKLEYDVPLNQATIVTNYEQAKKLIEEIRNNVENIRFSSNDILAEIFNKDKSFDKVAYSKILKIYELTATEVVKED